MMSKRLYWRASRRLVERSDVDFKAWMTISFRSITCGDGANSFVCLRQAPDLQSVYSIARDRNSKSESPNAGLL
jgi:hypothetical protein